MEITIGDRTLSLDRLSYYRLVTIDDNKKGVHIELDVKDSELEQWQGEIDATLGYAERDE